MPSPQPSQLTCSYSWIFKFHSFLHQIRSENLLGQHLWVFTHIPQGLFLSCPSPLFQFRVPASLRAVTVGWSLVSSLPSPHLRPLPAASACRLWQCLSTRSWLQPDLVAEPPLALPRPIPGEPGFRSPQWPCLTACPNQAYVWGPRIQVKHQLPRAAFGGQGCLVGAQKPWGPSRLGGEAHRRFLISPPPRPALSPFDPVRTWTRSTPSLGGKRLGVLVWEGSFLSGTLSLPFSMPGSVLIWSHNHRHC